MQTVEIFYNVEFFPTLESKISTSYTCYVACHETEMFVVYILLTTIILMVTFSVLYKWPDFKQTALKC